MINIESGIIFHFDLHVSITLCIILDNISKKKKKNVNLHNLKIKLEIILNIFL